MSISSWILSIAGIVCLSIVVELILPQGQLSRYIKGIFSFIIILVIVTPIPKLLKMDIDLSSLYDDVTVQEDYLYQLNLDKIMAIKTDTEKEIADVGYSNVHVAINADIFAKKIEIKSISVDISQLVITQNAPHKDIPKIRYDIVEIIQNHVSIEEGKIYFDE